MVAIGIYYVNNLKKQQEKRKSDVREIALVPVSYSIDIGSEIRYNIYVL